MTARRIDAWDRIQTKERSRIWYFFKYTLKDWTRRVFKGDFPEELLCAAFDPFYKRYKNNNELYDRSSYGDEEEYENAENLHLEIKALIEYWENRAWHPIDRLKDDQMFIRLVKIRHQLVFG